MPRTGSRCPRSDGTSLVEGLTLTVRLDVPSLAGMAKPCSLTFEMQELDGDDTIVASAALIDNLRFE